MIDTPPEKFIGSVKLPPLAHLLNVSQYTVLPKRVCPGLRIFPTIFAKTAVRQTGGGRLAAARNLIKRKLFLGPLYARAEMT